MRNRFDEQLEMLNRSLIEMGAGIEESIAITTKALTEQNTELARRAIEMEGEIDRLEKEIEAMCLKLLLQQHPVASDLRNISAALKMITDMERIGDQCEDIAEIAIILANDTYIKKLEHIPMMAEAAVKMVTKAVNAYVNRDVEMARSIEKDDDYVDELFDIIKLDLMKLIRDGIENSLQAMDLLMVAKYYERIADHAVNIAEWVVFSMTGEHKSQKIM
ncbi:MAG: phosphate signaling complex protein PhoU [Clostridia bacterium]|nr:phosphate signaling complex protein PhoU [Oscillospiraceae bacterium]MBQ7087821.1 phosphate signaling complex protein PhoU [Clostridia bacterium]